MENAALQPGTTPGLCPYGHTLCVPAVDAAAQRIQQLEQKLEETKKELAETKQQHGLRLQRTIQTNTAAGMIAIF